MDQKKAKRKAKGTPRTSAKRKESSAVTSPSLLGAQRTDAAQKSASVSATGMESPPHAQQPHSSVPAVDVDSGEPFNIVPAVDVPQCKKPRRGPPGAKIHATKDILGFDSQHGYVSRWVRMSQQEKSGDVRFQIVKNDGRRESLLNVLGLKNVFVAQLPNMPRPYVTRLVFDRKHESLALLKQNAPGSNSYKVMGGCCYRPFPEQGYAEVAFLAISQMEQIRGYGTRLMAQTKERAKTLRLTHLLTCADNSAVPYFKKQGFSTKITLPFDRWQGYIKDYDGVTLMECALHPLVDYLNIPMLLKAQKMALVEKMKETSNSHIVFPGIDIAAMNGMCVKDIPGLQEVEESEDRRGGSCGTRGGPTAGFSNRDKTSQGLLRKHLQDVLAQIRKHTSSEPFLEPVDAETSGAYNYYAVIKNPMDLRTMQDRLDKGWYYVTKEIFKADFKRMIDNAIAYNGIGHHVAEAALQLEKAFMKKL